MRHVLIGAFSACLVLAVIPASIALTRSPQPTLSATPDWTFESDQSDALLGQVVTTAGDVNGDGFDDTLVTAPRFDAPDIEEGKIYLFLGSASGLGLAPSWTLEGDQAGANLSRAAAAGDVNGDGFADIIVGALTWDNDQQNEGHALLYLGSASGLASVPAWTAEGDQTGAQFGSTVASAGDVNGDGYDDVLVGASAYDNGEVDEGRVYLYLGSAAGLQSTPSFIAEGNQQSAAFSRASGAGDLNGDGHDEVIMAAPFYDTTFADAGRVVIYKGTRNGLRKQPLRVYTGSGTGAILGQIVGRAGDVNGDGFPDVFAAAPSLNPSMTGVPGQILILFGSPSGPRSAADQVILVDPLDGSISGAAGAGDVDGDGFSELIVGHRGSALPSLLLAGRSLIYTGSPSGLEQTVARVIEGDQEREESGVGVGAAGDVNGDGFADIIIGAHAYDNVESNEGRAKVYHGGPPL